MGLSLRSKLFAIVAVAAIGIVVLTITGTLSNRHVDSRVEQIRDTYVPKIRLRSDLKSGFEKVARDLEGAVGAADADLLETATSDRNALLGVIDRGQPGMTVGQAAALRLALDDYFDTAVALSRKLIDGTGGEDTPTQAQSMQVKQRRVGTQIEQITTFDEASLTAAFDGAQDTMQTATFLGLAVAISCLVLLLAISLRVGRSVVTGVQSLVAGFQRFGRNELGTPIETTGADELGQVAVQANKMAEQLRAIDDERGHLDWVRKGIAGLNDELRGDLSLDEVANRTVGYLGRFLDAPVGALYVATPGGPYVLSGRHGLVDGLAPAQFTTGDGLLGRAAAKAELVTVGSTEGLRLRSGLLDLEPRAIAILPITHNGVIGVLELALMRPLRAQDRELLEHANPLIAIALEVSESRAASARLLDQTLAQARDLEQARKALEQQAAELARASDYKSQFLTSMSHELRTPLNAIIGFSEIMRDESNPLPPETMREYLGDILTSGRYLLELINDVLDLAKVEAGKLDFHPEPLGLSKLTGEVLGVLRPTATRQQIEVRTEIAPEVEALVLDPGRLKQVLYNYLSNALKFTPAHGTVVLRARPEGDDRVRIEVEDSGVGIAPEELGKLFGEYGQTKQGSRRIDSTGLGLALTKRLVEAQGGEVGVSSKLGRGSTFHVTLPRQSGVGTPATSTLQVVRAGPHAPTILVVEDDVRDRDHLVATLSIAGYAVETVATGAEALARCEARAYDAITLDLLLPDMTGLEVLRRIREGQNGKVPVIVVTVVAERGSVAGITVHDVLAKPLSEHALLGSLTRAGVDAKSGQSVVLVIDDDPVSLKVMAASLTRLGYLAVCEQDPVRGLRAATEEPPSAIVLDLLMPSMTGFEFLERFRCTPAARDVPVIVWTSKDLDREELKRLRESAHAVIAKGDNGNARVLTELAASLPLQPLQRTG